MIVTAIMIMIVIMIVIVTTIMVAITSLIYVDLWVGIFVAQFCKGFGLFLDGVIRFAFDRKNDRLPSNPNPACQHFDWLDYQECVLFTFH